MTLRKRQLRSTVLILVVSTWMIAGVGYASSPEAGAQGNYRGQCRRLTKQINHFEGTVLPRAIKQGNRGWEKNASAHIERLWHRRADLCPAYGAERTLLRKAADDARKVKQLVVAAGKAAATYFSGGLSGALMP